MVGHIFDHVWSSQNKGICRLYLFWLFSYKHEIYHVQEEMILAYFMNNTRLKITKYTLPSYRVLILAGRSIISRRAANLKLIPPRDCCI